MAGLELRNVVANYPFERSRRFPDSSRILATETIPPLAAASRRRTRRLLVVSRVSRYPEEGDQDSKKSQILTRMAETSALSVRFLSGALSAKKIIRGTRPRRVPEDPAPWHWGRVLTHWCRFQSQGIERTAGRCGGAWFRFGNMTEPIEARPVGFNHQPRPATTAALSPTVFPWSPSWGRERQTMTLCALLKGGRLESPTLDGCTGWILEAGLMKYLERVPVLFCENFGRSFETELFIPILSPRSGSVPCSRTFATRFKASKKSSLAIQRCLTI
jgi:hypothetical protein